MATLKVIPLKPPATTASMCILSSPQVSESLSWIPEPTTGHLLVSDVTCATIGVGLRPRGTLVSSTSAECQLALHIRQKHSSNKFAWWCCPPMHPIISVHGFTTFTTKAVHSHEQLSNSLRVHFTLCKITFRAPCLFNRHVSVMLTCLSIARLYQNVYRFY